MEPGLVKIPNLLLSPSQIYLRRKSAPLAITGTAATGMSRSFEVLSFIPIVQRDYSAKALRI